MPAILLADIDVTDAEAYENYKAGTPDVLRRFGGRYLALAGETKVYEGEWQMHRTVVIEFPSMDALDAFYHSEAYQALCNIRWQSADSRFIAIETLPEPKEP
ncbi:MAG: DUF1330 domain-containing protein [Pseudomonadota bacterium]